MKLRKTFNIERHGKVDLVQVSTLSADGRSLIFPNYTFTNIREERIGVNLIILRALIISLNYDLKPEP